MSAGNAHAQAQRDVRNGSSVSTGTRSSKQLLDTTDSDNIQDAGTKIFMLCTPWPEWTVSGQFLVGSARGIDSSAITASDRDGEEILSHIPPSSLRAFMSRAGQSAVSHHIFSMPLVSKINIDGPKVDEPPRYSHQHHLTLQTVDLWIEVPARVVSVEV